MDIKTPTSNESSKNIDNNLTAIKKTDVIKFVIGNEDDYKWSKKFITKNS